MLVRLVDVTVDVVIGDRQGEVLVQFRGGEVDGAAWANSGKTISFTGAKGA